MLSALILIATYMNNLPSRLIRYKDLAQFFIFHARPALNEDVSTMGAGESTTDPKDAEAFANSLEEMGPTFVKFGQLLSTRSDLLSPEYIKALQRLQDDVEPVPIESIHKIFEDEIGVSISKTFESFNEVPLAAASLGQTHRAVTRSGCEVVVKVQRPDIRSQIEQDLEMLASVAEFAEKHTETASQYALAQLVDQFKTSIIEELDYVREANNLLRLTTTLSKFKKLTVPQPHESFSSGRVLTMDFVKGVKITELSGFMLTEIDGDALVDELLEAYLHQLIVEGFFHADPHPGNLLLTDDRRIAFMDLGMVGRLSDQMREAVYNLFSGISENKNERVVDVLMSVGLHEAQDVDRKRLSADVSQLVSRSQDVSIKQLQFGALIMRIIQMCANHGVLLPREFNLIGKALLNLDRIAVTLAPNMNPSEAVAKHLKGVAMKRALESLKPGDAVAALVQMKDLFQKAPQRLNSLLDILSENKFRINADVIDETALIQGFQKVANRITIGLIVAALIVGAALIMRVESSFELFGYPGFAMILMIIALILGSITVFGILKSDR